MERLIKHLESIKAAIGLSAAIGEVTLTAKVNMIKAINDAVIMANECNTSSIAEYAYLVDVDNEASIIIAENMADACDKIEKTGCSDYEFVYSKSLPVVQ